jgi:PilZ domain-containing protein
MEHRWGQRFRVDQTVRITARRWSATAHLRELSASGAYVECSPPPARIMLVTVELGVGRRRALVAAELVRRERDGFALEWREFAPRPVRQILLELSPPPESAIAAANPMRFSA